MNMASWMWFQLAMYCLLWTVPVLHITTWQAMRQLIADPLFRDTALMIDVQLSRSGVTHV